jgi:hypothetical protein
MEKLSKKLGSTFYFITFLVCTGLVVTGCSKNDETAPKESTEPPVVAQIGDSSISAPEFKSYLSEKMPAYKAVPDEADVKKRLESMVVEEVLYQEGLRLGLNDDPLIRQRIRQMIVQKLLEEQVNQKAWKREITADELRQYYDRQQHKFNRPELVRLADIFIAVPPDASPTDKDALKQKAQQILAEAIDSQKKRSGFGLLIRKYSDTPEKYRRGDTGFIDRKGNPNGIDPNLAAAGFELARNGSIHERVIETSDGYHVIMRIGKRSAMHTPFEKVSKQLEQQLRREEVQKRRKAYIANLKNKADIRLEDQLIADIAKEVQTQYGGLAQGNKPAGPPVPAD